MEIDCGLGAFFGLQKGYVLAVIHKKVLGQDSRATGVADDVEVLFDVGISVGVVSPEAHSIPALRTAIVSTWLTEHSTKAEKAQGQDIGDRRVRLPAVQRLRLLIDTLILGDPKK